MPAKGWSIIVATTLLCVASLPAQTTQPTIVTTGRVAIRESVTPDWFLLDIQVDPPAHVVWHANELNIIEMTNLLGLPIRGEARRPFAVDRGDGGNAFCYVFP